MGKLLLKYDGTLIENFCPLDGPPPYQAPDRWDGPHVQVRFAEALETLLSCRWDARGLLSFGPAGRATRSTGTPSWGA
jgi:hypothetical protein